MANMAFEAHGDLIVGVHNASPPSAAEWDGWMATCQPLDPRQVKVLVFTDGGGPNAHQRDLWNKYLDGAKPRLSVVTDSTIARGIITAMRWLNNEMRAFAPEKSVRAIAHLRLPVEPEDLVSRTTALAEHLTSGMPNTLRIALERLVARG
jgi:hypothetical protein